MAKSVNRKIITGMIVFIIGAVVGGAGIHDFDSTESAKTTKSTSDTARIAGNASDFRAHLVMLAAEHMVYTDKSVGTVFGEDGASIVLKALYANGTAIATQLSTASGDSFNGTFATLWHMHIDDFMKYAVADSRSDISGKVAALTAADTDCTRPLAQYLSTIAPSLSEATLEAGLRDHVAMTAKMIDYRNAGDYTSEQMELDMASAHIENLFSSLANAIVQQNPHYFLTNKDSLKNKGGI